MERYCYCDKKIYKQIGSNALGETRWVMIHEDFSVEPGEEILISDRNCVLDLYTHEALEYEAIELSYRVVKRLFELKIAVQELQEKFRLMEEQNG